MITFLDEQDVEYGAQVEFKYTNGVNGERSISGTIYTNEDVLNRIDKGWRLRFNDEYYVIIYSLPVDLGNVIEVEFDAVHQFFYDFKKSIVHQELNGSNKFAAYVRFIFQNSGYEYRIEGQVNAIEKQSFGFKDRLSLFNDIIKSSGAEFQVNGRVVRIMPRVGTDLSTIVKKNFNLNELKIEKNINDFVTYKKGYGAWVDKNDHSKGRLEVEYASPLMSIYGKIEAEPIIDERYTNADNLIQTLKDEVDSSYSISVSIDFEDLTKAGYQYDQPVAGDYIMAINDDLQFREKIRIVSFESHYDVTGNLINHKVTCNDIGAVKKRETAYTQMSKVIANQEEIQNKALEIANMALVSANGKNKNYYGTEMPVDEPKGTLITGDTLFLKVGDQVKRYYWNGSDWIIDPFDADINFVENKLNEVFTQFEQEKTATSQAIDNAIATARQEAEALDQERQQAIDTKMQEVNNKQTTLEQSIATAEQNAQSALQKAGASEDLAKTAKEVSESALSQFQTTSAELAEVKETAEETLQNALNALSGANSVITQSQTLLDNAEFAKTEAGRLLTTAQQQLEASGVISGDITTFKEEVNNTIKGYVTQSTYDSNNATLNTRLTEWEKTADGFATSISEVEGKVDNLKIGGTNLLINSEKIAQLGAEKILDNQTFYDVPYNNWNNLYLVDLIKDTTYTISVPVYNSTTDPISSYISLNGGVHLKIIQPNEVTKHVVTFTASQTTLGAKIYILSYRNTNNLALSFGKAKLEIGNVATDWSRAVQDDVSQSEYAVYKNETQETIDGFTRTVSAYEQDVTEYKNQVAVFNQTVDGYTSEVAKQTETVGELTTEVANYKQAVDGYSAELSKNTTATNGYKTEVAGYKQTVDGYASKLTEYTQSNGILTAKVNSYEATVDGYTQTLETVEGKIDNLQVGGRNLLIGSEKIENMGVSRIVENRQYNDVPYIWYNDYTVDLFEGETYTLSVPVYNSTESQLSSRVDINGGKHYKSIKAGEITKHIVTVTASQTTLGAKIYILTSSNNNNLSLSFGKAKLEKGNIPTDWSPAPEDLVSQSEYTVYKNEIKSTTDEHTRRLTALDGDGGRISKVEQTASQIQTNLSDYAKTSYVDTKITTKAGEINTNLTNLESRVDSGLPTNLIVTTNAIPNSYVLVADVYPTPTTAQSGSETMKDLITVYPGKKYYFSKGTGPGTDHNMRIKWLDSSKKHISRDAFNDLYSVVSFTSPSNAKYCWVSYPVGGKPMMTYEVPHTRYYESQIDSVTRLEFQTVKETTELYERVIGTTETAVKSNIAQIVMSDSLFQTTVRDSIEVGSTNLIPNSPIDWIPVTTQNIWDRLVAEELPVQGATTYTYSLEWQKGLHNQSLFVRQTLSDGTFSDLSGEILFGIHQNGRNSMTFTTNPLTTKISLRIRVTDPSVANSYKYRRPKLEKGNIATDWSPAPEDKANQSQVTQLSNSWALNLKSGNDIKTAINATTDGIRLKGSLITLDGLVNMTNSFIVPEGNIGNLSAKKITSGTIDTARLNSSDIVTKGLTSNVVKSNHILADTALFTKLFTNSLATQNLATQTAWIKSSMIGDAQIGTAQIGQIDAGTGKIINIDAQYITANHAKLVSAGFQGLNSNMHIDGGAIRINNNDGDFATMNAIPEFRSQDSAGTSAILGKGRSQYYSNNQSRFYIGSSLNGDEYNGSVVHGVHISKNQTWGIYRQSDAFGGTPAQYFKTPAGWGAVQVVEELMRTGKIVNNFSQASALIRRLNGWGNSWPILQPGDMVMYQAAVPGNSSGIERIWTMGNSSNGTTRTYSHVHHVFEGGTTGVSDERLKHDINPTDIKALEHISKLAFKQFKWNRNDEVEPLGLIAQESGILRVPDEELEGIDIQRGMMLALKGVQELSQKLEKMGA